MKIVIFIHHNTTQTKNHWALIFKTCFVLRLGMISNKVRLMLFVRNEHFANTIFTRTQYAKTAQSHTHAFTHQHGYIPWVWMYGIYKENVRYIEYRVLVFVFHVRACDSLVVWCRSRHRCNPSRSLATKSGNAMKNCNEQICVQSFFFFFWFSKRSVM